MKSQELNRLAKLNWNKIKIIIMKMRMNLFEKNFFKNKLNLIFINF